MHAPLIQILWTRHNASGDETEVRWAQSSIDAACDGLYYCTGKHYVH